jgi:hypothetical protein
MGRMSLALLADHSLLLHADSHCWPLVRRWLPLNCDAVRDEPAARASITIGPMGDGPREQRPNKPSALRLGQVHAWMDDENRAALLCGTTDSVGRVDLESLDARLELDVGAEPHVREDAYSMLTVSAALLLGRMGRALIHAAAVADPSGRSWLIVGDAGSGKSTTCVGLAGDGHQLLSDDQVILSSADGNVTVEGWVRPLHLDEGWEAGAPTGQRRTVEPSELGLAFSPSVGTVMGTLHPAIAAEQPTGVTSIPAAEAFTNLVRQSPWLLADRLAAEAVVGILSAAARLPSYALSLGLDTYGRGPKLRSLLDSALV